MCCDLQGLFVQVSAASHHACAVSDQGQLECWGGDESSGALRCPHLPGVVFTQVTVSDSHACALTTTGSVHCWGRNTHGEGNPPREVHFTTISCGARQCCGIALEGDLRCWGGIQVPAPTGSFSTVSVGPGATSCAVDVFGRLHCWGTSFGGKKGGSSVWEGPFVAVSSGSHIICAVKGDGSLFCLGESHELWPNGTPSFPVTEVAVGSSNSVCAITAQQGKVVCWSSNKHILDVPDDLVPLGYADSDAYGYEGGDGSSGLGGEQGEERDEPSGDEDLQGLDEDAHDLLDL